MSNLVWGVGTRTLMIAGALALAGCTSSAHGSTAPLATAYGESLTSSTYGADRPYQGLEQYSGSGMGQPGMSNIESQAPTMPPRMRPGPVFARRPFRVPVRFRRR